MTLSLRQRTFLAMENLVEFITGKKYQKIAGTVVFRKEGGNYKFLLLKHKGRHWDFPKGKVETDEFIVDAARRELIEETGLKSIKFILGFIDTFKYKEERKNRKIINKIAFFYLVKTRGIKIKISKEHRDFQWAGYSKALKTLTFENSRILLKKCNKYIKKNAKKIR